MTKFTITVNYTLAQLRAGYRVYHGTPKTEKITKKDIATWLGGFAEADAEDSVFRFQSDEEMVQK